MTGTSLKKNIIYQVLYEILVLLLPFVTSPYIARVIGAEGLGVYSYSYTIASYFVLFSMLGIKNYGNRRIAQCRKQTDELNEAFSNVVTLHIGVSLVCCIAYVGYINTLHIDRLYAIIMFAYVLSGLFDVTWFYQGIEKVNLIVTINTVIKFLNVFAIFVFVKTKHDLWKYCVVMATGMLISQIALWFPLRRYVKYVKPSWKQMRVHLKPLLVLFVPAVAVSLYKYMDKIMLGAMTDKVQLGYYENAEKVINLPMSIIVSFGTVMLARMSNLIAVNQEKEIKRYIVMSMKYIMGLAIALACGLSGVGPVFAPVFWGEEFTISGRLIVGLATTIPFMAFANVLRTQYLIPKEKDKTYVLSVMAGAVVNFGINWLLIPQYGAIGATVGTIAAEIAVCVYQTVSVRNELPVMEYVENTVFFLIVGIVMYFIVRQIGIELGTKVLTLFVQIAVGVAFYGICALLYLVQKQDELVMALIKKKS